jgi:ferredoxin
MMPTITRDADRCAKCGICVLTCPVSTYVQDSKDSVPEVAHADCVFPAATVSLFVPGMPLFTPNSPRVR